MLKYPQITAQSTDADTVAALVEDWYKWAGYTKQLEAQLDALRPIDKPKPKR